MAEYQLHSSVGSSLVLSIIASIDNLVVGVVLGLAGRGLSVWTVGWIAMVNLLGTVLFGVLGAASSGWGPAIAGLMAAFILMCVGCVELWFWCSKEESLIVRLTTSAWMLGIILTLNNLTMGMASGLAGSDVFLLGLYSFGFAIFFLYIGYWIGLLIGQGVSLDPRLVSGVAFIGLGLLEAIPHLPLLLARGAATRVQGLFLEASTALGKHAIN